MPKKVKKLKSKELQSADIVSENIDRLKKLFPEACTENGVDFDVLRQLLGCAHALDEGEEKFGLNWHGKKKARQIALTPSTGTLLPCPDESIDWDTTQNIFIEGDNLEVLKLLQRSYSNKVKMIYIDPPYNTGKEFIYPDKYQESLDTYLKYTGQIDDDGVVSSTDIEKTGRKHTNWLNMMYPRIKLAKSLLKRDGCMFISIDENELSNLKALCDEIYGQENFVECITWNKRIPKNDKGIGNVHEYILLYTKDNSMKQEFSMRKDGIDDIYNLMEKVKKKGLALSEAGQELKKLHEKNGYDRGITLYKELDEDYRIWGKINMSWPNADTFGPRYEVLHPITKKPVRVPDRGWRWKKETFDKAASRTNGQYQDIKRLHDGSYMCGRIWFAEDENTQPSSVRYLDDVERFLLRSILSMKSDGGIEMERLFEGKSFFSYPKPISLMKALFSSISCDNGDIYLDFFAGSATSAHAISKVNIEDSTQRRYILVQFPEPLAKNSEAFKAGFRNLADLAKARIRKVHSEILNRDPDIETDLGFKSFKLSYSNIRPWNPCHQNIGQSLESLETNLLTERSEQDILYELLLKRGLDLAIPIEAKKASTKTIHSIGHGQLFACLAESFTSKQIEKVGQAIVEWHQELTPDEDTQAFFRDSAFRNDVDKTNMVAILEQNGIKHVRSL